MFWYTHQALQKKNISVKAESLSVPALCNRKEAAALVGGGGGGRPNMAQAGGKNPAGIKAALEKAVEIAKEQL